MANDWMADARFWAQVIGDSKRTVICPPEYESRCKGYVAARGLEGIITVEASPWCPEDRIFVFDTPAMRAYLNEATAKLIRF